MHEFLDHDEGDLVALGGGNVPTQQVLLPVGRHHPMHLLVRIRAYRFGEVLLDHHLLIDLHAHPGAFVSPVGAVAHRAAFQANRSVRRCAGRDPPRRPTRPWPRACCTWHKFRPLRFRPRTGPLLQYLPASAPLSHCSVAVWRRFRSAAPTRFHACLLSLIPEVAQRTTEGSARFRPRAGAALGGP